MWDLIEEFLIALSIVCLGLFTLTFLTNLVS